jgi:hypothetical protein
VKTSNFDSELVGLAYNFTGKQDLGKFSKPRSEWPREREREREENDYL